LLGDNGPIKRFELKELLGHHREWHERTRKVSDAITKGDLPLIFENPSGASAPANDG
jgi:hypothetical protein